MHKPLVIFVTTAPTCIKSAEENLGLAYLAAVCRKDDIEVIIIDGWLERLTTDEIIERILLLRRPLFLGFSCNLLNGDSAIEIVEILKSKNYNVPFIAGGYGPTFEPGKFLKSGFDYVSVAEGEETILDLCSHFYHGYPDISHIKGLYYYDDQHILQYNRPTYVSNLNELPFPSRDTIKYAVRDKIPINVLASRGCMSDCLFCSISAFGKLGDTPKWRERDIYNIVDELEQLYSYGIRHFKFVDDSFIEPSRDEEWCNTFADEINRRGLDIRFRITLRADRVSEGIMTALRRAGCESVACGIENFSDSALKRMGKKANVSQNQKALDIFKKCNLYVQMGFILFDYGTTLKELRENYELMNKYSWTICKGIFSEMYAATGTSYTRLLQKGGLITGKDIQCTYEIEDVKARMVYKALKDWHISFMTIYNMVVEPINKPKALNDDGLAGFYNIFQEIRKLDLEFMGNVLDLVENDVEQNYLNDFVQNSIKSQTLWFEDYRDEVEKLYVSEGIVYMADEDPFTK
ncbi:radical SAM superfamily enzyme YgiQ (UPF0313 family) [Clostridium punense]|uniref:Radical SAM superfamily enzyme YgiQ (UPF0313 family) n=1 Tax=Clostridium punense TaxID=1054297 RepID=A0ABS4K3X1_9CLOT|nr:MULTISPECIES: radical SAM protein [Clostridium]EQB86576.1 hypothetical protein M918_13300 [Clostridium sp. BL8]MBP2022496.1 radical SAM superfamily enzyme YgiQ (UPF0313 family) [Clostridium punense]